MERQKPHIILDGHGEVSIYHSVKTLCNVAFYYSHKSRCAFRFKCKQLRL